MTKNRESEFFMKPTISHETLYYHDIRRNSIFEHSFQMHAQFCVLVQYIQKYFRYGGLGKFGSVALYTAASLNGHGVSRQR